MKKRAVAVCLILLAIVISCILAMAIPNTLSLYSDIASPVHAATIYYDIKMKILWDQPYNLDLYVTEPDGEIASLYNTVTLNGGEIGYYDRSTGEWVAGDSGDNEAPEVYRIEHAPEGTYEIDVYCPGTSTTSITTEALIYVTLYEGSSITEYKTFPQEGTQTIYLNEEGWWYAGTFGFKLPEDTGCFIGTAVYGSAFASEVSSLRDFRDKYLLKNDVGRWLVNLYYKFSPPCANFIGRRPFLKKVIRMELAPLVFIARLFITAKSDS